MAPAMYNSNAVARARGGLIISLCRPTNQSAAHWQHRRLDDRAAAGVEEQGKTVHVKIDPKMLSSSSATAPRRSSCPVAKAIPKSPSSSCSWNTYVKLKAESNHRSSFALEIQATPALSTAPCELTLVEMEPRHPVSKQLRAPPAVRSPNLCR
jgi:hypothetical protein